MDHRNVPQKRILNDWNRANVALHFTVLKPYQQERPLRILLPLYDLEEASMLVIVLVGSAAFILLSNMQRNNRAVMPHRNPRSGSQRHHRRTFVGCKPCAALAARVPILAIAA
ncbi:hypothetical protein MRX96_002838 [Rhipicephalus microplus]